MDSITKLRGTLREAENLLQYVSKELEKYSDADKEKQLNFAELKLRGEQYSFYEHPLKGQIFQDDYLALLIYLISLGGKKEEGWTVLYRIAAGCDYQGELQNLTTDALTFTEERLSELIRNIYAAELANIFAIDSLMISHHMGADDAQLKFLAGVYELLKIDKNFLIEAMEFVKVLDATYWDNPVGKSKAWTVLTAKDVAPYIGGTPAASLGEAAGIKKNRVIIVNATHTSSSVLLLDDWKANEILFLNCRFENCAGIYSTKKVVKFLHCTFNQENFTRRPYNQSGVCDPGPENMDCYRWKNEQYNKYKELYHFENATLLNCNFKHFKDATAYFYLGRGLISDCKFEDIKQTPACCLLLKINNAEVSHSQFINCHNSTSLRSVSGSPKVTYSSCLIYSANTLWKTNKFINCSNRFPELHNHGEYYRHSARIYMLFLDKQSRCNDCVFEKVDIFLKNILDYFCTPNPTNYELLKGTAIIGLYDSYEENNEGATVARPDIIEKKVW